MPGFALFLFTFQTVGNFFRAVLLWVITQKVSFPLSEKTTWDMKNRILVATIHERSSGLVEILGLCFFVQFSN